MAKKKMIWTETAAGNEGPFSNIGCNEISPMNIR
jgi:hypothetical protein